MEGLECSGRCLCFVQGEGGEQRGVIVAMWHQQLVLFANKGSRERERERARVRGG